MPKGGIDLPKRQCDKDHFPFTMWKGYPFISVGNCRSGSATLWIRMWRVADYWKKNRGVCRVWLRDIPYKMRSMRPSPRAMMDPRVQLQGLTWKIPHATDPARFPTSTLGHLLSNTCPRQIDPQPGRGNSGFTPSLAQTHLEIGQYNNRLCLEAAP